MEDKYFNEALGQVLDFYGSVYEVKDDTRQNISDALLCYMETEDITHKKDEIWTKSDYGELKFNEFIIVCFMQWMKNNYRL